MAATFTLELDTTPPSLTVDTPYWDENKLCVPFSSDGEVEAEFEDEPMTIEGGLAWIELDEKRSGEVMVRALDDLWNEALANISIMVYSDKPFRPRTPGWRV